MTHNLIALDWTVRLGRWDIIVFIHTKPHGTVAHTSPNHNSETDTLGVMQFLRPRGCQSTRHAHFPVYSYIVIATERFFSTFYSLMCLDLLKSQNWHTQKLLHNCPESAQKNFAGVKAFTFCKTERRPSSGFSYQWFSFHAMFEWGPMLLRNMGENQIFLKYNSMRNWIQLSVFTFWISWIIDIFKLSRQTYL